MQTLSPGSVCLAHSPEAESQQSQHCADKHEQIATENLQSQSAAAILQEVAFDTHRKMLQEQ